MELRAALIQYSNALEKEIEQKNVERACVLRIKRIIERHIGISAAEGGVVSPNAFAASIAGAVGPVTTT